VENNFEQQVNQQSPGQQPPISEIPKSGSKFGLILLIFILLLIIVGGIYFFVAGKTSFLTQYLQKPTSTPLPAKVSVKEVDPTVNWKTYDGVYPISFLYPGNLKISEGDADYFSTIRLWNPLGGDNDSEFSVFIYKSSKDQITQNLQKKGFSTQKEMDIDGLPAIQLDGTSTPNTRLPVRAVVDVLVEVKNQVYVITNWRAGKNDSIFQKILNSVKFTDQNQATDISTWKTYVNKEYGFELKYPLRFQLAERLSSASGETYFIVEFRDNNCSIECSSMEISIRASNDKTFEEIKKDTEEHYAILYSQPVNLSEKPIAGRKAFVNPPYETNLGGVTVVNEKYIYSIFRAAPWHKIESNEIPETLFNQILSTFKFTN
jgi:hypothetical protein